MKTYRVIVNEIYFIDFEADGFRTNAETGTISILVKSNVIAIFCIKNIIGVKFINE